MSIEEEVFKRYKISKNKLLDYGFQSENNILTYEKNLKTEDFKAIFCFDKFITGKIIDNFSGEEYTNYRIENTGSYSSEIRQEFIDLLTDIRDKCSEKQLFSASQTQNINNYIIEKYHDLPEFLWKNFPTYAIYRKKQNNKWYALIGSIAANKVNKKSSSKKIVEIINLKVDKDSIEELLNHNGIYEAYHMNKKNWITIILDNTLTDNEVTKLIDISYSNV